MGEFRMPSLGADMDAGTIVEWRVRPGDTVHHGDIVAVVDTEKSTIEVEVFEDGVVEELLVTPGVEVPVGTALARLAPLGVAPEAAPTPPAPPAAPPETVPPPPPPGPGEAPAASAPERGAKTGARAFVAASPLARREAAARDLDLATLPGSGPGGAVVARDLPGAGPPGPTAPPGPTPDGDRQAGLRHAIGELMARSKREIPHYYLATSIDLEPTLAFLADANATRSVTERVLPAAALLKATALAAREHPAMNGFWDRGVVPASAVHLGVAVALRNGGLVAPAIHDADQLSLEALMAALADLVRRARTGALRSSEMADPTLTVTNLGDQGAEEVYGVIYPPQVALVGFGRIVARPWATGDLLGVRRVVRATLAADHRVSDGHDGARFLATVDRLLQTPQAL